MAKILASVAFIFLATLAPASAIGPIVPENYEVYVQDWDLETPKPFLSFDKFGMRQGYYLLSFHDKGKKYQQIIHPEAVSTWRNDYSFFAEWKSEELLRRVARSKEKGPLNVQFSVYLSSEENFQPFLNIRRLRVSEKTPESTNQEPEQNGWKYLTSEMTPIPSQSDLNFDRISITIIIIFLVGLLPASVISFLANQTKKNLQKQI